MSRISSARYPSFDDAIRDLDDAAMITVTVTLSAKMLSADLSTEFVWSRVPAFASRADQGEYAGPVPVTVG